MIFFSNILIGLLIQPKEIGPPQPQPEFVTNNAPGLPIDGELWILILLGLLLGIYLIKKNYYSINKVL